MVNKFSVKTAIVVNFFIVTSGKLIQCQVVNFLVAIHNMEAISCETTYGDKTLLGNVYNPIVSGIPEWLITDYNCYSDRLAMYFMAAFRDNPDEMGYHISFCEDQHCTNLKDLAAGQEVFILDRQFYEVPKYKAATLSKNIDYICTNHKGITDLITINAALKSTSIGAPVISKDYGRLIGMVSDPKKGLLVTTDIIIDTMDYWIGNEIVNINTCN